MIVGCPRKYKREGFNLRRDNKKGDRVRNEKYNVTQFIYQVLLSVLNNSETVPIREGCRMMVLGRSFPICSDTRSTPVVPGGEIDWPGFSDSPVRRPDPNHGRTDRELKKSSGLVLYSE